MVKAKGQSARERMKKHREKVKSDPLLYEEMKRKERERYKRRFEEGKIKNASSKMTDREKRKLRKQWKEKTRRYRAAKKQIKNLFDEGSPPPSPSEAPADIVQQNVIVDKRKESGQKKRRKHREKLKSRIKELESQLKNKEAKLSKYKKRLSRMNAVKNKTMDKTPRKLVKEMLQNQKVSPEIKKRFLFCTVMEKQILESFVQETSAKKKRDFANKMAGAVVKKYRFLESIKTLTSKRIPMKNKQTSTGAQEKRIKLQQTVKNFFLLDENSRSTAGKKETITRRGLKKQKRFMNDSMKGIYAKFVKQFPELKISYSLFCLYRPFWVLRASEKDRDTCLCRMHENFEMLVRKLRSRNIISYSSPEKVVEAMTCEDRGQNCLERKCPSCKNKMIEFSDLDLVEKTTLNKWVTQRELITIKGKEKTVQKTIKTEIELTNQDLFQDFNDTVYKYFQHIQNIKHQYKTLDEIKGKLKEQDLLIHMDFSENYSCKYASEVQSSHFGASKKQISLHTVVVYYYSKESKTVENKCFATITDNLRHDPAAIFAHMQPVVIEMKMLVGEVKTVHILTDGPTTQYRNRTIFYLLGNYAPVMFGDGCMEIHWHYSEAGHGKGAPDGIGGCLKRTADRLVSEGKDITGSKAMLELLSREIRNVKLLHIDETFISHIDHFLPDQTIIRAFKGTMLTHEVVWVRNGNMLRFRRLSCTTCKSSEKCSHYDLGSLLLTTKPSKPKTMKPKVVKSKKLAVEDVYTDSDADSEPGLLLPHPKEDLSPNDFVVVDVEGKKCSKQFIALVQKVSIKDNEASVSFLKHSVGDKFVFPQVEDKSEVDLKDIVQILNPPQINKRGHHFFKNVKVDFPKLQ